MSALELQKTMHRIQALCEDLENDLNELDAPDFDSLRGEIDDAEQAWDSNQFSDSVSYLDDLKSKIDNELSNVCNLDSREEIMEWIQNMPTASFMDFA